MRNDSAIAEQILKILKKKDTKYKIKIIQQPILKILNK